MQKWEYCRVHLHGLGFFTPNGCKDEEIVPAKDAFSRRIAELGLEGWELVGVDRDTYYFKRPLSEAEESEG